MNEQESRRKARDREIYRQHRWLFRILYGVVGAAIGVLVSFLLFAFPLSDLAFIAVMMVGIIGAGLARPV